MLLFYQFCLQLVRYIHIRGLSQLIMILLFLCMIYIYECVYMCSLYLCILLRNRAAWQNSVTEWSTLHKIYIINNKIKYTTPTPHPVFKFSNPFAPPLTSNPGSALGCRRNPYSDPYYSWFILMIYQMCANILCQYFLLMIRIYLPALVIHNCFSLK